MTETTEVAARTITNRYLAVWSEPNPQSRHAAIASLWEPAGAEYLEGTQFRGHEEIDARIAHAYEEFVAGGKYNVTMADDMTQHDDIITFTVQLSTQAGQVAWAARVFLFLGDAGYIREDYQLTVQPLVA